MEVDFVRVLQIIKETGGLGLLALLLFWGVPQLIKALDRNTRMIYNLAIKLKIDPDTDIVREIMETPPKGQRRIQP